MLRRVGDPIMNLLNRVSISVCGLHSRRLWKFWLRFGLKRLRSEDDPYRLEVVALVYVSSSFFAELGLWHQVCAVWVWGSGARWAFNPKSYTP